MTVFDQRWCNRCILRDRWHYVYERSACIDLHCFGCMAACGVGARETPAKQWVIDESKKQLFDKEWEVKGSNESKIAGSDLQGFKNSDLGLSSHACTLWRDKPKKTAGGLLIFKSTAKRVASTAPKLHFYPRPGFSFILRLDCTFQLEWWN